LKDLSCVSRKSYDAHSCVGEEIDHIISEMTRSIIHQYHSSFFSKFIQSPEFREIR
jgi:hypothetical protein